MDTLQETITVEKNPIQQKIAEDSSDNVVEIFEERNTSKIEVDSNAVADAILSTPQVPVSKLEPTIRFNKESPAVCKDFHSSSGVDALLIHPEEKLQILCV